MVQEGAEYSCMYKGKESMRIDVETTIWRGLGVCRVYQEGFNRISGRSGLSINQESIIHNGFTAKN
jgi:hypothetical protein